MVSSDRLLAALAELLAEKVTPTVVDRVCVRMAGLLPVDGIAVTITAGDLQVTLGASDEVARRVELAELTVGVGPGTEAAATGATVAVDDLTGVFERWPGLGDQLNGVGVAAIAAVPLRAGSVTIGSLDAYRGHPHRWTAEELDNITRAAQVLTLAFATVSDLHPDRSDRVLESRDRNVGAIDGNEDTEDVEGGGVLPAAAVAVAQATGMVMAALGVSPAEALSRLRGAAFAQGRLVTAVAGDLITRRLPADLDDDPRPAPHR